MPATATITVGGVDLEYPVFNPTFMTPPLSEDFPSDGDWLIRICEKLWKKDNPRFRFDEWQKILIRHVLEVYPEGHPKAGKLVRRQVIISMGRQNGKTELGAAFSIYGLLKNPKAYIVGIAYNKETADVLYSRTIGIIESNKTLQNRIKKATTTRGISTKTGGVYQIKASRPGALQGLPITLGLVDELHILKPDLWSALLNGTGGRDDAIVIGITTAGDENSDELKHLYEIGMAAVNGDPRFSRVGCYIFEAPEAIIPDDDVELAKLLIHANPSYLTGRIDIENVISDIRSLHPVDAIRYRLNRFVNSVNSFITGTQWARCQMSGDEVFPQDTPLVFGVDRTPDLSHASVVAATKKDGITYTEVVRSFSRPTDNELIEYLVKLNRKFKPATIIFDGNPTKPISDALKKRGVRVRVAGLGDILNASPLLFNKIQHRELRHDGNILMNFQIPQTTRKNFRDGYKIARKKETGGDIDLVIATNIAVFAAESAKARSIGMFT